MARADADRGADAANGLLEVTCPPGEVGRRDDHLRPHAVEVLRKLGRSEPQVHRNLDHAGVADGEVQLEEPGTVGGHDRHPTARPAAERLERTGQTQCALVRLREALDPLTERERGRAP